MSELLKVNVSDHIEKKNGLSYLSWAWAWAEVLKIDPAASWTVLGFKQGEIGPLFMPDGSAMVYVSVTIHDNTKGCVLPVMDHRNKAIKNPDAFAINTAYMRCLAKAIAMHGLGLYIYAGEDLPEEDVTVSPAKEVAKGLQPEIQDFLSKAAPRIDAAMPDIAVVVERILWVLDNYPDEDRNEIKNGLWSKLGSKTRTAVKKFEDENGVIK